MRQAPKKTNANAAQMAASPANFMNVLRNMCIVTSGCWTNSMF